MKTLMMVALLTLTVATYAQLPGLYFTGEEILVGEKNDAENAEHVMKAFEIRMSPEQDFIVIKIEGSNAITYRVYDLEKTGAGERTFRIVDSGTMMECFLNKDGLYCTRGNQVFCYPALDRFYKDA